MNHLVIIGAGGFGREVCQYALDQIAAGRAPFDDVKGFLDPDSAALDGRHHLVRIIGSDYSYSPQPNDVFCIALGDPRHRGRVATTLASRGVELISVIHPSAYVAPTASLGRGVIMAPFAFVGPDTVVGDHVVFNTYASCGHDSRIGECSVLSPYATVNGGVEVGARAFLGSHAVVVPGRKVGAGARIAAGSVATRDVPAGALAHGNPAQSRVMYKV